MPRGRDEMQVNVAGLRRNIKNLAHNYSDAQVKVREATSNDPWGPSSTLMAEIADLTYNVMAFTEIMQMIWKRLNDHGKNWRHVYKALVLMEYLIKTGSEKVAMQCKENIYAIHTLKDFQYMEEGKDQGLNVREKAKQLVNLLKDEERLKNERARALKAKQRFAQSANAFGSDGALDTPSSPTYPPVSEHSTGTGTGSGGSWAGCEAELARPLTAGEEELQLQLALAMSREEAEREERRRRSDDVRLQLALSQSQNDFQLEEYLRQEYLRQEYYRQQYSCLSTITEHSTKYEDQEIDSDPEQNNENWQWSGNGWQPFGNNGQWHYNGWQPYGNNWHWSNNGWQPSGNNWDWSHNGWQSFKNNVRWRNRWQLYNKNWPINGWQPFNKNWQYLHNYLPPSNKDCQPSKDWLNNRRHQSGKDWQCSTDGWKVSNTDPQCLSDGWQPSGNKRQTSGNDWRPSTNKQCTEQPEKCWFRGWFQCLHQSVPAPLTTEKKSEPAQSHLLDLLDVNLSPSGAPAGPGGAPLAGAVPALGAAGLDPWAINTPQHKPETSADSWSVVDSPARDPWAAPPPPDPWAPAAPLHNHLAQNKSPVSVLSSPSSGELGEFDTLSQRRNNNTEPDPFDLTGLGENVPASSASPVQSATGAIKKSPSAFLGENSSLVNLERLLQPAPADLLQPAHNPFADRTTTTPQPAKLTINELKQQQMGGGFPVGGPAVSDPWAPATGGPNNGALNNGAPAAAGWALPTRHTPNPFLS